MLRHTHCFLVNNFYAFTASSSPCFFVFYFFTQKKEYAYVPFFLLYLYSGGCTKRYKKREKFNSIMLNMRHETLYMEANEARWMALEWLTENGWYVQTASAAHMFYDL